MNQATLENKIRTLLQADGKDVIFDYKFLTADIRTTAYTINKSTKEQFMLKSADGIDKEEGLQQILDYIKKSFDSTNGFTVRWAKKENGQLSESHISYFYCHDILEVATKFFEGKSVNDYVIYEIKLNPIT